MSLADQEATAKVIPLSVESLLLPPWPGCARHIKKKTISPLGELPLLLEILSKIETFI